MMRRSWGVPAGCSGAACRRINPGNIGSDERVKEVVKAARDNGCSMRIGVNAGSLERDLLEKYGEPCPEAMVESALDHAKILEDNDFFEFKISCKASDVFLAVAAYQQLAEACDYPLHLGVTEAGPPPAGLVKSTAGIGTLLAEGIGDTIRYSLTADPVEEARAGRTLLEALGLRERRGLDLIACPSCGRAEIDVIGVAKQAQQALEDRRLPILEANSRRVLCRLLGERELRQRLIPAGQERVEREFAWPAIARQTAELYGSLSAAK